MLPLRMIGLKTEMRRLQDGGLAWLQWPLLAGFPEVEHRIWTRHGGVSPAPYETLNLGYGVGDAPAHVQENRSRVRQAMGLAELISVGQIHGSNTLILTDRQTVAQGREVQGVDILITNLPGVGLLIKQADCQAVVLYDPEQRVIANVHCGWRGNVHNVLGQAVGRLQEVFGSRPAALLAGISPSLGPCCAEFKNFRREMPAEFWGYQVRPTYFDLWRLSVEQLLAAGLVREHIQVAGLCSRCQAKDFYSYRRDGVTGRNGTVVALRQR